MTRDSAPPALTADQLVRGEDRDLALGAKLSLILHLALVIFMIAKGIILPSDEPLALPPVLRVDVVGLPDLLKQEKTALPKTVAAPKAAELPPEPKSKEEPAKNVATKDEMVLKPKSQTKDAQETKASEAKQEKDRKKKISSALDRIKALNRIENDVADDGIVIKGNRVSPGTSTADDAREAGESSYLDLLRDHLADNWALPVWLSRQQLSAQVRLYIDGRGKISSFRFVKASGNTQFDDQVQRTLKSSEPYPVPPGHVAASLLRNGVLVRFPL